MAAAHRGHGYGRLLKEQAVRYIEQTQALLYLFYSYIEAANERSLRISWAAGFEVLGHLEAFMFDRLYPRSAPRFGLLSAAEEIPPLARLHMTYQGHSLVHFDHVYDQRYYFVLRENGVVMAGVQANPVQWRIETMPGLSGQLLLHVLPHYQCSSAYSIRSAMPLPRWSSVRAARARGGLV